MINEDYQLVEPDTNPISWLLDILDDFYSGGIISQQECKKLSFSLLFRGEMEYNNFIDELNKIVYS